MFTSFTARNYKNLTAEKVALGRVNLLVGPNNCGKSNFLRAFGFAGEVMQAQAFKSVVDAHGGLGMLPRGSSADVVGVRWEWASDFGYEMNFHFDRGVGFSKLAERGKDGGTIVSLPEDRRVFGPVVGKQLVGTKVKLSDMPLLKMDVKSVQQYLWEGAGGSPSWQERFRSHFSTLRCYHSSHFHHSAIASPVPRAADSLSLSPDGLNLSNFLWTIDQSPDGLDPLKSHLREALRDLERIWIREGGDYRWVSLKMKGQEYSLREVSDGTLQILLLSALLFGSDKMSVLGIDEPELNLHPAWLRVVASWMMRANSAEQIFVSTHSSDLLDAFTEGFRTGEVHLLVFNQEGEVKRVSPEQLDPLLVEGWELGDIYRVGDPAMGGWPW